MLKPSRKKYKSVKRFYPIIDRKLIHSLLLDCYKGHLPMKCNCCPLSLGCWFCGLKEVNHD